MGEFELYWRSLQADHESYERCALGLKAAVLLSWPWAIGRVGLLALTASLLLAWLLEAIWRTGQARLARQLLALEQSQANAAQKLPRLYLDFAAQRGSSQQLVKEYLRQALKPTVAWLYPALVGLSWWL